ncbi:YafY family protein [Flavitalea sp. BT771]|uniref:helix-turn-helix transcriptional regulator n=1 Tax=Flavitalea sp. BT771 TaxID=3063329 RepID=UPI0026E166EA|nr:YafY family protein [Flavitalea sp. BT771]MDO6434203.1 YafY family protein [Flavitalea sp. BT771]MDV6223103.1 YafY family protein [Flavitalea sp. BT771]
MNRIDRLHAILTHLQSKRLVTAQEMADRFNISLRTVYRDVKALDESGVPVIGEAGTGYTIMEGYRLPPVMFSREEASALLLGSKLAERFADEAAQKHFSAALYKIKAVLRGTDKDYVEDLTDHIAVVTRSTPVSETSHQYLSVLQQAAVQKRVIDLQYHSSAKEETTLRQVEPIGLLYYSAAWHLIGWCRLRKGLRDFRLSRMLKVVALDEIFDASSHPSVHEYMRELTSDHSVEEVVIQFDKHVVKYLREQKYLNGFVSEEDLGETVRMKFMTSSVHYFGHWLLTYAGCATVESPSSLKNLMKELAERLIARYGNY